MNHILYINLARTVDRKLYMENQFKNTSISAIRIDAVDYTIPGQIERVMKIPKHHNTERKFLAITASHLKAIHTAHTLNLEQVIISEDDIDYNFFLNEYEPISAFFKCKLTQCELIQLHSSSTLAIERLYKPYLNKPLQCIDKNFDNMHFWGATSYLITKKGISKIMRLYNKKKARFELDTFLQTYNNKLPCLSDMLLYLICKSKILTIPLVNISQPHVLPSTVQNDTHVNILHTPGYNFIKKSSLAFSNTLSTWKKCKIPAIIHQTWKDTDLPHSKFNTLLKIIHPDWEFKLWTDKMMNDFVVNNYPQYHDTYNTFILNQKLHFFRYLIVYHCGGFYLDLDIVMYKKLDSLRTLDICLFNEKVLTDKQCVECKYPKNEAHRVANYAFGASIQHPFMLSVIKGIVSNIPNYLPCGDVLNTTGSGYLTTLYHSLLPCTLIYPTSKPNTKYTCTCQNWKWCKVGNHGNHLHVAREDNLNDT